MISRINPSELAAPAGFSHAVAVPADSRLVFLSGQTALDADGKVIAGGLVEQFEQALGNLLAALAASGGSPQDLVSMTVYVTDIDDYKAHSPAIGARWRQQVGRDYPAMAAVGIARLWDIEAMVELQAVAAVQSSGGAIRLA